MSRPSRIKLGRGKYCSKICYWENLKGRMPKNTEGLKLGSVTNKEVRIAKISNEFNYNWKGDKVSYSGLHKWVARHLGKPALCEFCGTKVLDKYKIHWANKSHEYKRELSDWLRLCMPCHKKYDGYEGYREFNSKYV